MILPDTTRYLKGIEKGASDTLMMALKTKRDNEGKCDGSGSRQNVLKTEMMALGAPVSPDLLSRYCERWEQVPNDRDSVSNAGRMVSDARRVALEAGSEKGLQDREYCLVIERGLKGREVGLRGK